MNRITRLLIDARRDERAARQQWFLTLDEFQERSTPSNIAGEAWEGLQETVGEFTDKAVDAAKKRPATLAAIGSALALFLFRKRIASAIETRIAGRNNGQETERADEALDSRTDAALAPSLAPRPTMTEETGR